MTELSIEAINDLQSFLGLLVFVIAMLTVGLVVVVTRLITIEKRQPASGSLEEKRFEERATELLERGQLQELIDFATSRLTTHPYHVDARWYLAVGYYHLGEMGNAVREFEHVAALNPAWEESGVVPFIEKICAVRDQAESVAHH